MKLIIKGVDSGKSVEIPSVNMVKISDTQFIYVLDDITTSSAHFKEKFTDFTPGENIEVQATVHNNSELTNVGYSAKKRTNSLFDAVTTVNGKLTASVSRMRHLENLDSDISGISYSASDSNKPILGARQTKNLEWRVLNPSASSVTLKVVRIDSIRLYNGGTTTCPYKYSFDNHKKSQICILFSVTKSSAVIVFRKRFMCSITNHQYLYALS